MAKFAIKTIKKPTQDYNKYPTSLLDILKSYNLDINYQCRQGYCGICRIRLLKGTVFYFREPLGYIQESEILPCCCWGNNIIVDI